MHDLLPLIASWIAPFILIYFAVINGIYALLLFSGALSNYFRQKRLNTSQISSLLKSKNLPEITFIMPAYNEAHHIIPAIDNLLNLSYSHKQIIIINDGSTDDTLKLLKDKYHLNEVKGEYREKLPTQPIRAMFTSTLHSEIIVIDKENGTRYDALNAGLNVCKDQYFITVDADTFVDNDYFCKIVPEFLTSPNIIAVGATLRVRNGCTFVDNQIDKITSPIDYISAMQSLEYLRSFAIRQGWNYMGGQHFISGAFSVFVTEPALNAGGFAPTFGNDLEIVIRLNRVMMATQTSYAMKYLPDPVALTEAPHTFKRLGTQRMLWHRGFLEALWFHKSMLFNPKYGIYGFFVYPFLICGEAFEPIVESLAYLYIIIGLILGVVNASFIVTFITLTWGFTFMYSLLCLILEDLTFKRYPSGKELLSMFFYSFIEILGYRQMTILWKLNGFRSFFQRFNIISENSRKINASVEQKIKDKSIIWKS